MGTADAERQSARPSQAIVAFDFDGTMTVRDSYRAFLAWRAGAFRHALGLLRLIPAALAYLADSDHGRIKMAATRTFLAGVPRDEIERSAAAFADTHFAALLRPDALAAWRRWKADGAMLVIVTASPEVTVAPFAERLGADRLIGTRLEFDAQDRVTGRFIGPNCRNAEKVRRLREAFGGDVRLAAAYGDTSGDTEMLALADERGFKVFRDVPKGAEP
jgi:phosphatidylglycerophosphatase C